jgi:hypothetical protein
MAKTHSWAPRATEILARAQAASRQSWRRPDIERLFEVKRATAQTLMKLIGGVHLVGATHLVDRSSLVAFLEDVLDAPTVADGVARRWLAAEPAPDGRGLRQLHTDLPPDLHSIMARHLPPAIALQPGALVITGADSTEILEHLCLLAQALQNDLATIQTMLDPPPTVPSVEQDELRAMFARLRDDENAWQLARQRG